MNSDPRDYKLDVSSLANDDTASRRGPARPFLSILFECCGVYQRIYRDTSASEYRGCCPRCGMPVRFPVSADGTAARFFRVR